MVEGYQYLSASECRVWPVLSLPCEEKSESMTAKQQTCTAGG